jgi:hypothetical protein
MEPRRLGWSRSSTEAALSETYLGRVIGLNKLQASQIPEFRAAL